MAYRAVVFDMDGVLLTGYHTDREVYRDAAREVLADFDADFDDGHDDVPPGLVDPDDATAFRDACARYDIPPDPAWGYREHASTAMENARIDDGAREPFDDTDVLAALADDAALGVVSNNRHGTVTHVVESFGWAGLFDVVRGRVPTLHGLDRRKPAPDILDAALAALGVAPAETLFVGDRYSDVEAGANAGTDTALLTRDGDAPPGSPDPTHYVETLREIPSLSPSR